jgi:chemotaxis receptor (MCP) glutamine deamidase CheD
MDKKIHLFEPPHSYLGVEPFHNFFAGAQESYSGDNRPLGALLSIYSKEGTGKDSIRIEIGDEEGNLIREIITPLKSGINRLAWDLKTKGSTLPGKMEPWDEMMMGGAPVFFGRYTIRLAMGDEIEQSTVEVRRDPKMPISDEDLRENIRRKMEFNQLAKRLSASFAKVDKALASIQTVRPLITEDSLLLSQVEDLTKRAEELKGRIMPKLTKGILGETPDLRSRMMSLSGYYSNPMAAPEENSPIALRALEKDVDRTGEAIEAFMRDYRALQAKVNDSSAIRWQ